MMLRTLQLLAVVAALSAWALPGSALADTDLLAEVNTLQGTDSVREFSYGNTLPLVGAPFWRPSWAI